MSAPCPAAPARTPCSLRPRSLRLLSGDPELGEEPEARIRDLLERHRAGHSEARDELFQLVYAELHAMARRRMCAERADHTLQATALVHEAYLRVGDRLDAEDRLGLLLVLARAMRQALIDHARRRRSEKRGGRMKRTALDCVAEVLAARSRLDLLDLHDAVDELWESDARLAEVVELRFFGGLSTEETAELVGVSTRTIENRMQLARLHLHRRLGRGEELVS